MMSLIFSTITVVFPVPAPAITKIEPEEKETIIKLAGELTLSQYLRELVKEAIALKRRYTLTKQNGEKKNG